MTGATRLCMSSFDERPGTGTRRPVKTCAGTGTGKDGNASRETGGGGPADASGSDRYLPHERLDVYRVALELHQALAAALPRRCTRELRDQLVRASTSIVLNIAEGAGRTSHPDKQRFYEIAKGSATESAAVLDLLRIEGSGDAVLREQARRLAIRVVQMLTRMSAGPR